MTYQGLFMESKPGTSDVYVPLDLLGTDTTPGIGYVVTVVASESVFGTCLWRATRVEGVDSGSRVITGKVIHAKDHEDFVFIESEPGKGRAEAVYMNKPRLGITRKVQLESVLTVTANKNLADGTWVATSIVDNSRNLYKLGVCVIHNILYACYMCLYTYIHESRTEALFK